MDTRTRDPALEALVRQVQDAGARRAPLVIEGGGTRAFYGNPVEGEALSLHSLSGISSYEPTELVMTVRAGTPLAEVEAALAGQGQMLAFEPPRFGPGGTVGGMVAAGLSGPARAAAGSVRDHVLGASLLNGRGEVLSFGGQVMKNVAGYDVSRLLAGSLGTLGVILEVSLKVLPTPAATSTLAFEFDEAAAIDALNRWGGLPLPLNASAWFDGRLWLRLAGASAAVEAARVRLGGEPISDAVAEPLWSGLRDQDHAWFAAAAEAVGRGETLWRLSVPSVAPPLGLGARTLVEWGGAQRWLVSDRPGDAVRDAARAAGGHAVRWHGGSGPVFAPLSPPLARIHRELKAAFDPLGLFNRGRLYPDC